MLPSAEEIAREVYANIHTPAGPKVENAPARSGLGNLSSGSKPQSASASTSRPGSNSIPGPTRVADQPSSVVSGSLSSLGGAEGGALLGLGYGSDNDSDEDEEETKDLTASASAKHATVGDGISAAVKSEDSTASQPLSGSTPGPAAGRTGAGQLPSVGAVLAGSDGSLGKGAPDAGLATLSGVSQKGDAATRAVVGQEAEKTQVCVCWRWGDVLFLWSVCGGALRGCQVIIGREIAGQWLS